MTLFKRITLVIRDGVVEHVFYPVFPRGSTPGRSSPGCGPRRTAEPQAAFVEQG